MSSSDPTQSGFPTDLLRTSVKCHRHQSVLRAETEVGLLGRVWESVGDQ